MSNSESSDQFFPSYWRGYVTGTNRAEVVAQLKRDGEVLKGRAAINDRIFGAVAVDLSGTLRDQRADLELHGFCGLRAGTVSGVTLPVTGKLNLNMDLDAGVGEGQWETDIGTKGSCRFQKVPYNWFRFSCRIAAAHVLRWIRLAYLSFLVVMFLLDAGRYLQLSYAGLILALVPGAYLFRFEGMELIRLLGVKKAWGVEFQQPGPQNLPNTTASYVPPSIQEAVRFVILDQFFALATKIILIWLSAAGTVDRAQFEAVALQTKVPQENIEIIWSVLLSTGCAAFEQNQLRLTEFGQRYVTARLRGLTAPTGQ
jgi:hypothetical protein